MARASKAYMEGVLKQYIRYCDQWQRVHGQFRSGDGRSLILKNAKKALGIK